MPDNPDLALGDSGEHVTMLQERLRELDFYDGAVDGDYGQTTEAAVRRYQETTGLHQDGRVGAESWAALEPEIAETPTYSDDGQWWWDGANWQAVAAEPVASAEVAAPLSPDGEWQWDGAQWLPVAAATNLTSTSTADALTGFEPGLADLLPEHLAILDAIAADLNAHGLSGGHVTLTGGADRHENPAVARQRAEVVRDYLVARVTDEDTRREIRAYSVDPDGDGHERRRVDLAIVRRGVTLPRPQPGRPLERVAPKTWELDPRFNLPKPKPDPGEPEWVPPEWLWKQLPPAPPKPDFLRELSAWLNKALGTRDLARLAGRIAGSLGIADEATVRRLLEEAFQTGGEDAVKHLLRMLFDKLRTLSPQQPGLPDPAPFPKPDVTSPEFRS